MTELVTFATTPDNTEITAPVVETAESELTPTVYENEGFKIWTFYHNDHDGHCAAAIVKHFEPKTNLSEIQYGYKSEQIFEVVNNGDTVFFVDFSPSTEDMQKLVHEMNCHVVWLDHHISAIERLKDYDFLPGLRDMNKAGCELAWEYCASMNGGLGEKIPNAVKLVGRYDVWDHKNYPECILFHYGLGLFDTDPADRDGAGTMDMWRDLFADNGDINSENPMMMGPVANVLNMGDLVWTYRMQHASKLMGHTGYLEWEGKRWLVLNGFTEDSYSFMPKFDEEKHDAVMWFYWAPKSQVYKFSIRSDKKDMDLHKIAEKFGGGGHAGAAGFAVAELPFSLSMVTREPKTDAI